MATEILRPNAAGDEEGLADYGGTGGEPDNWSCVDEAVADDGTTYVFTASSGGARDLYNIPASSGSGVINKITVHFRCWTDYKSSCRAKASIKSNSIITDGDEKTLAQNGVWEDFSQEWAVNPADSEAWEWADIDALQIGVALKGLLNEYYMRCTQVYVVVDYTVATNVEIEIPLADTVNTVGVNPTIARDAKPTIPLTNTDGTGLAPTVDRDTKFDIPLSAVTSMGLVPAVGLGVGISIPLATINSAGIIPTFTLDTKPDIPLATIDSTGVIPSLKLDKVFTVPVSAIAVSGLAPTIIEGIGVLIGIPIANADGAGISPTLVLDMKTDIPLATIDSEGIAPSLVLGATLYVPLALIDVDGFAPTFTLDMAPDIPLAAITVVGLDAEFYFTPNRIIDIFLEAIRQALLIESVLSRPLAIKSSLATSLKIEIT